MSNFRINKELKDEIFFITITTIEWINIFDKIDYFEILLNCIEYHQNNSKLNLFGYVFMTNHIHLLAQSPSMIAFLQNFKSFTTKMIKTQLKHDNRKYILTLIYNSYSRRDQQYFRIWQGGNWPIIIESESMFYQKLDYIHENPVLKGYVDNIEDWKYSSAKNYISDDHSLIEICDERMF